MKRRFYAAFVLLIAATFIMGCKIETATPDPDLTIEAQPGDTLLFSVEVAELDNLAFYEWSVDYVWTIYSKTSVQKENYYPHGNEFEFIIDPEILDWKPPDEIRITCEVWFGGKTCDLVCPPGANGCIVKCIGPLGKDSISWTIPIEQD